MTGGCGPEADATSVAAPSSMPLLALSRDDIAALTDWPAVIASVTRGFVDLAGGDTISGVRQELIDGEMILATMPAISRDTGSGAVKVVCVMPGNRHKNLPGHQGLCVLFEAGTGAIRMVAEAGAVTELRTAAAAAVATKVLARRPDGVAAIVGSGSQALPHIRALSSLGYEIVLSARNAVRAAQVVREADAFGIEVTTKSNLEEAVRGCDVLVTLTSSATPIVESDWVQEGTHINAMGSSTPRTVELPTALVDRCRLVVDDVASARQLAGELAHLHPDTGTASLGEVLSKGVTGRSSAEEITLFKSVGTGAQDLHAMSALDAAARDRSVGTFLAW